MESTVLNPVQLHLLRMFAHDGSEKRLEEIKVVLTQYFSQKLDEKFDALWDEGVLDQKKLDELKNTHLRTPYIH